MYLFFVLFIYLYLCNLKIKSPQLSHSYCTAMWNSSAGPYINLGFVFVRVP